MHKNNFDFLRFLFAFIVVLSHVAGLSGSKELSFLAPYFDTYLSITGFFIISGFLIPQSYSRSKNLKKYFSKRMQRLLPGYIFIILSCSIFLSLVSTLSAEEYFTNPGLYKYTGFNLVFLNFIAPCLPGVFEKNSMCAVNGALWTLKIEVSFYLLVPVLALLINKFSRKFYVFLALYCLGLLYKGIFTFWYNKTGNEIYLFTARQLPGFMTYFVSGIALNYYFDKVIKHKHLLLFIALPVYIIERWFNLEILSPLALAILILYVSYSIPAMNNFGKNGDFSYGIYIIHFPLVQLFATLGLFKYYNPWVIYFILISLVLLLSVISWNFIEKPFLRQRKKNNGLQLVSGVK